MPASTPDKNSNKDQTRKRGADNQNRTITKDARSRKMPASTPDKNSNKDQTRKRGTEKIARSRPQRLFNDHDHDERTKRSPQASTRHAHRTSTRHIHTPRKLQQRPDKEVGGREPKPYEHNRKHANTTSSKQSTLQSNPQTPKKETNVQVSRGRIRISRSLHPNDHEKTNSNPTSGHQK